MTDDSSAIKYLPVEKLLFDPENPRLPSSLNKKDETAVLTWMLDDATILELMMSIGEKGYFEGEPLLVVEAKDSPGKFIVIEGNRRLTAAKLLLNPDLAPIRKESVKKASIEAVFPPPKELPALIFKQPENILYYLGYRHITGIKTWGSLAKAKYLKRLQDTIPGEPVEQYRALAKIIGSTALTVSRYLAGLAVFEKIVDENLVKDLNEDKIDFAVLTTALNYQNIYKYIGMDSPGDENLASLNLTHLAELASWMFEKFPGSNGKPKSLLGESRNLGDLNRILAPEYEKALNAFKDGRSLSEAVLLTSKPIEIFETSINEAKARLEDARNYMHMVNDLSESHSELLVEIRKIANVINVYVKEKLVDSDES